jgi:hypothetical protein
MLDAKLFDIGKVIETVKIGYNKEENKIHINTVDQGGYYEEKTRKMSSASYT